MLVVEPEASAAGEPTPMTPQPQPKIQITGTPDYREAYANSVQVRLNVWDFFLVFGTVNQPAPDSVQIRNFQGIYLSPQQAKALANLLTQNVQQYEATFGELKLEPRSGEPTIQ
jgi:flagellar protein FlaG